MVKASEKKTMIRDTIAKTITFSKRRFEISKKANELSTWCGAVMAIIIFSSTGEAYAFGNSSVETIIDRFSNDFATSEAYASNGEDGSKEETRLSELYKQYFDLLAQVEAEKKRGEELKQRRRNYPDITKMNRDELVEHKALLEDLKQFLDREILSNKHGNPSSMGDAASSIEFQPSGLDYSANDSL